jgi:hypothetical protein
MHIFRLVVVLSGNSSFTGRQRLLFAGSNAPTRMKRNPKKDTISGLFSPLPQSLPGQGAPLLEASPGKLILAEGFDSDDTGHVPAIIQVCGSNGLVRPRTLGNRGKQDAMTGSRLYREGVRIADD